MKKFLLTMSLMTVGVVTADVAVAAARRVPASPGKATADRKPAASPAAASEKAAVSPDEDGEVKARAETQSVATQTNKNKCAGCAWTPRITDPFTYVSRHYPRPGEGSYPTDGSVPQPIETSWPVVTFIGRPTDVTSYLQEGSYANIDADPYHHWQPPAYHTAEKRAQAFSNKQKGLFGYVITMAEDSHIISHGNYYHMFHMLEQLTHPHHEAAGGPGVHPLAVRQKACEDAYEKLKAKLKSCEIYPLNPLDLANNRKKLVNLVNNFDGKCYPFIAGFKPYGVYGHPHYMADGYDARIHLDFDAHKRYIHFIQSVNGQVDMNNDAIFKKTLAPLGRFVSIIAGKIRSAASTKAAAAAAKAILEE